MRNVKMKMFFVVVFMVLCVYGKYIVIRFYLGNCFILEGVY